MRIKIQIICLLLLTINIFPILAQRLLVQPNGAVIIDTYGMNSDILALDPILAGIRLKDGRTAPHSNKNSLVNRLLTPQFEIAPVDVSLDNFHSGVVAMNWYQASGWSNESYDPTGSGCYVYPGTDSSQGKWRVPTFYEALLIRVFKDELDKLALSGAKSRFVKLDENSKYFTATGDDTEGKKNYCMYYSWGEDSGFFGSMSMTSEGRVRCIREVSY